MSGGEIRLRRELQFVARLLLMITCVSVGVSVFWGALLWTPPFRQAGFIDLFSTFFGMLVGVAIAAVALGAFIEWLERNRYVSR